MKSTPINLEEYKSLIALDQPFSFDKTSIPETEKDREILIDKLLAYLMCETKQEQQILGIDNKEKALYSLLTIRQPEPLPAWFNDGMDRLLQWEFSKKEIIDGENLTRISKAMPLANYGGAKNCALWRGDISTLKVDAIVNAANSALLGCLVPFHRCIDNVIHTGAGPRVREDCNIIMEAQGFYEGTGWAKITRAYNLPSKFILHTVGPIYNNEINKVSFDQHELLADCYKSCLNLASSIPAIKSIAFCCISTGLFGFPANAAAKIALKTVEEWLNNNPGRIELIVFNVFSNGDENIYREELLNWKK